MQDSLVYLNGSIVPTSEAKVSVLDRGFLFGDGIYEVIPAYRRKLFRAAQHLARLFRNLSAVRIANPHTEKEWMALIEQIVGAHPADDQIVYMQVTRGVAAKRTHAFPSEAAPTVFMMSNPMARPSQAMFERGVACVSMEDRRWLQCDIKSTSLLGNVLAAQHAVDLGAVESIQFRDGWLTEASASNVWVARHGVLSGPPKDNLILEGIRYGLIEEFCAARGIPLQVRRIARSEVFEADEVIVSSATKEVLAVVSINGAAIGNGKPGPIFRSLYAAYQDATAA